MIAAIVFEFPSGWLCAVPAALAVGLAARTQSRRGLAPLKCLALAALRMGVLLLLIALVARPVWIAKEPPAAASRAVALLLDRSESMSLEEPDVSRYQQALDFLRVRLLPALKSAGLPVQAMLFDQNVEAADGPALASATPKGKRTNLGG